MHVVNGGAFSISILSNSLYNTKAASFPIILNENVFAQSVVRKELQDRMVDEVDISSPREKIRDFMTWSRDILEDARRQRQIMTNPVCWLLLKMW